MGAAGGVQGGRSKAEVVRLHWLRRRGLQPCGSPTCTAARSELRKAVSCPKQAYVDAGHRCALQPDVSSVDVKRKVVQVASEGEVRGDTLVLATGFNYAIRAPGGDLGGLTTSRTSVKPGVGQSPGTRSNPQGRAGLAPRRREWSRRSRTEASRQIWWTQARGRCRRWPTQTSWPQWRSHARARCHPAFQHDPQGVRW